jgi:hypothetical protein
MSFKDQIDAINARVRAGTAAPVAAPATPIPATGSTAAAALAGAQPKPPAAVKPDRKGMLTPFVEAAGRKAHIFPVNDFLGPEQTRKLAIGIRVNRKFEDDDAFAKAHAYAARRAKDAGDGADAAKKDFDILGDAKLIETLWYACREVVDPDDFSKGVTEYNAFPGPEWMRKNLSSDQLAALWNLYLEARRKDFPARYNLEEDRIEALAEMAGKHADTDIPESVLGAYAREAVTHAFVVVSRWLWEARTASAALLAEYEKADTERAILRARVAELEALVASAAPTSDGSEAMQVEEPSP